MPPTPVPFMPVQYDLWVVGLSFLIASYASYVALDLAKRVRTTDRAMAMGWWIGGSMAMGTGVWAMHFVGMLALQLPMAVGYGYGVTALSWVAAVVVSAIALSIASHAELQLPRLATGALAMGGGICVMHYTGMAALDMAPGVRWDIGLVAASAAIAVAASAVALLIFFGLRRLSTRQARRWQFVAALVMGAAICGMHYTGMAAAAFPEGAVCLSADQLNGNGLGLLVTVAAVALLTLTMVTSALDTRMQRQTADLTASLHSATRELQQQAFRDALTGLPNRLLFDDRVHAATERCVIDGRRLAVLFVDLDGFKPVNDSFGHARGDEVLREIARRLAAQARGSATVARIGSDEFVLLMDGVADTTAAAQMAQALIETCAAPLHGSGPELRLSCSVGITMFPGDGPPEALIAQADAAMQAAKRVGGGGFAFFERHMNADVREQIEMQVDLRLALAAGELRLHYQPKVCATSGVVTGAEALLRWPHPRRGMVSPAQFIPVAERFGLIGALGDWVIHQACAQVREWLDQGLRLRVAINLSVHQLRQDDLVDRIEAALAQHRVDASLLTFEITESVAMDDTEGTFRALARLRSLGVGLSIDDFGTGYSSLSYLRRLRADQLKIDRSFVMDLESSADARAIVEAVVRLAHALGLRVVAEGVETAAQRDALQALHCDELQGYLFARPMPAEQLQHWAAARGAQPDGLQFAPSAYLALAD